MKLLVFACLIALSAASRVRVTVYYESLCPDSIAFVRNQLYPTYWHLKDHILISLVPYGKASHQLVNNKWSFQCQHGNFECVGNKYHACSIEYAPSQDIQVAFLNCIMNKGIPAKIGRIQECVTKNNINWAKVEKCATTKMGDDLLAKHGDKTMELDPLISFVPTITLNDVYDQDLQELSLDNFAAVVCSKIEENPPEWCDAHKLDKKDETWDTI